MKQLLWILPLLLPAVAVAGSGEFEREVEVEPGSRLEIELHDGDIEVVAHDGNELHIFAEFDGDEVEAGLQQRGSRWRLVFRGKPGVAKDVDCEIRMPSGMALQVRGYDLDLEVEGLRAAIGLESIQGDIWVRGGREEVDLVSVHGSVSLSGAEGRIRAISTNDDIELRDCQGRIVAETVNGDIRLGNARSDDVQAVTVNGDILYDGSIEERGQYSFSTHHGDIVVGMLPTASAKVSVATWSGEVRSDYDFDRVDRVDGPGKRFHLQLGSGSAELRLESFDGDVELYDPKGGRGKRGR